MHTTLLGKLAYSLPWLLAACLGGSNSLQDDWRYVATASDDESVSSSLAKASNRGGGKPDPKAVYAEVYRLIREDYYEQTYNGQDWERWQHKYDGRLKTLDDAHKAIETMLFSLGDRYTRFLDNDAFSDEKSQIQAHLTGIGVQIGLNKEHKIYVVAPLDDTPAAKAGILAQDEITEIDHKSTKGFSVEDAAKHIRGELNSSVLLTIQRLGKRIDVPVTRAEISIKAVSTTKMLKGDIGYIRLTSFISEMANKEMRDAISKLSSAKGIVLDLRDNPGGLLTNAIDISNMFLSKGTIVSTVDRDGYKAPAQAEGRPICSLPMVILINKGSASASEITSGALKDNGRAMLVGQRTFGKGLVQGINKLADGTGVNVTIARYLTPSDTDINKKGIAPDVDVEISDKDVKDGKGPWWLDPESPAVHRTPDDLKDMQLKAAVDTLNKELVAGAPLAQSGTKLSQASHE